MCQDYNPSETWIRYGLSDLFFAHMNQGNDVFRYGTFFFIMAAEKHLKAVLINAGLETKPEITLKKEKRSEADDIARKYSHNFKKMIGDVENLYESEFKRPFVPNTYLGFDKDNLIKAMYEGYMETRYPTITSSSQHFPYAKKADVYHSPIGSSFFTDFTQLICQNCWRFLLAKGMDLHMTVDLLFEQFGENEKYASFKTSYLNKLPKSL